MACKDCLLNCDDIISDQCVQYTGPEVPLLGICPGDQLSKVEANIIAELLSLLDGSGIEPTSVTISCSFLQDIIGVASPTLSNILQMLITASCTLKDLIDTINQQVANNPVFNTACLTGLPSSPTRDDILQATVNLVCSIKTTVDAIPTTYVKNTDLTTLVTNIVNNISGGGTVINISQRMIPYTAVAYFGPGSNFDSGGKGVAANGFDKIYVCNGSNGTPDLRGRVVTGAVRGVPGSLALDPAVDPALSPNTPNWGMNDKAGECFHILTIAETPTHTHTVIDPGHKHQSHYRQNLAPQSGSSTLCWANQNDTFIDTTTTTTGISLGAVGGGQPHNNIQPTIAAWYIMYIP
jgi:microcystin-dependent protein